MQVRVITAEVRAVQPIEFTLQNKCTKVPGTLARTYANEHMCIFN